MLKYVAPSYLNKSAKKYAHILHDKASLTRLKTSRINIQNLRDKNQTRIQNYFKSAEIEQDWLEWKQKSADLLGPDNAGGVNPGDQKALYFLIRQTRPQNVLEVGTHIGMSTVTIAAALQKNARSHNKKKPKLVTVDIFDVNDPKQQHWKKYGSDNSPKTILQKLELDEFVTFETSDSVKYLKQCKIGYDFIFLDGNHSAQTVYKEVPLAFNLLNKNGNILLHDYFPNMKPLWSDGSMIPGPYLALQKLQSQCSCIRVAPLGALPWPTKLNSNVTSLALILRERPGKYSDKFAVQ